MQLNVKQESVDSSRVNFSRRHLEAVAGLVGCRLPSARARVLQLAEDPRISMLSSLFTLLTSEL